MQSINFDEDRILTARLQSDDELACDDTDGEVADHESEDDVQSDMKKLLLIKYEKNSRR